MFTNATNKFWSLIMTSLADVDGFKICIQVWVWLSFRSLISTTQTMKRKPLISQKLQLVSIQQNIQSYWAIVWWLKLQMEEIPKTTIALEFGNCFKESILIVKNVCNFFVIPKFNQVYVLVGHLVTILRPDKHKLLHVLCQEELVSTCPH